MATDAPELPAHIVTMGSTLIRMASALDAIADALTVSAATESGIDEQARGAARHRINLRSLRRNHPAPEEL